MAIIGLGLSSLLLADDAPRQKVQISKTERIDFQAGGVLRIKNSAGEVAVEGWDRPDVEITTVKSTKMEYPPQELERARKELEGVHIAAHRDGDELVITTDIPGNHSLPRLLCGTDFYLDYRINVPANTRMIAEHTFGEVHVNNLTSDIQVAVRQGEITLGLPEEGRYAVNARSSFGSVVSDFAGREKRKFWLIGHQVENESSAPHKLDLRIGYGDIIILKTRVPKIPPPLTTTARR